MSLHALPPELKLTIAENLDPQSCLHLALTCRDLYNLCQTMLEEHERLFSELRVIRSDQTNRHVLWTTLREVLKDPRKGWYVRDLDLPASRWYHWDGANLGQHGNQEEDQEIFQQAARALRRVYRDADEDFPDDGVIRTIELRIGAGYDDGIIAVLIHHLPFLKTIRITDLETIALEHMLMKIAASYKNQSKLKGLPLQHLTSASVAHWDSEYSCNSSWAADLLSLPSMHFFAANAMSGHHDFYGNPDTAFAGIMPYSNLTELYLISCAFDVENLEAILAGIRGLRKFTYTDGGATVSDSEFEPKKIIAAVAKLAGHSLEELRLDRDMADASFAGERDLKSVSLRAFQKLKLLNCEWWMLLPEEIESDVDEPLEEGFHSEEDSPPIGFDIRNILPESLEELHLDGTTFDDDDWEQLTEIMDYPNAATPNLDKMRIVRKEKMWPFKLIDVFGDAPQDRSTYQNPITKLLEGHGYL